MPNDFRILIFIYCHVWAQIFFFFFENVMIVTYLWVLNSNPIIAYRYTIFCFFFVLPSLRDHHTQHRTSHNSAKKKCLKLHIDFWNRDILFMNNLVFFCCFFFVCCALFYEPAAKARIEFMVGPMPNGSLRQVIKFVHELSVCCYASSATGKHYLWKMISKQEKKKKIKEEVKILYVCAWRIFILFGSNGRAHKCIYLDFGKVRVARIIYHFNVELKINKYEKIECLA